MSSKTPEVPGFDDSSVEPGVWRYAKASRASVIVDGADYFALMQQAMCNARERVLLVGWDFDTRIHLAKGRRWWQKAWKRECPSRLGSFILWLARHNRGLEIRILKWSYGWFKFLGRGSMLLDLIRWWPHRRIDLKFDTAHPVGCCHHQKIVVIDDKLAVCGGIDMTTRRWDTREHLTEDPRRKRPRGKVYGPWHDATMMVEGEVASALGDLGRNRWIRAGGKPLDVPHARDDSAWPDGLAPQFQDVEIGISRTRAKYKDSPQISEVETLFLRQIARAKRFIYAENQYFASRRIAEAMAERLREPDPPEIVIVHPETADGAIEATVMDPPRDQLVASLRELDRHGRFNAYNPFTDDQAIYVHAKIMIIDDEIVRVGSSNFNNRSLGLDSECDVFIDCARPANAGCGDAIRALRHSLLAEHCGLDPEEVGRLLERHGSMQAMIASLGNERRRTLRPIDPDRPNDVAAELAQREVFDPERPDELFEITPPRRGLFREGTLLARAMQRLKRKQMA